MIPNGSDCRPVEAGAAAQGAGTDKQDTLHPAGAGVSRADGIPEL
jgi:hypothetical protein